mmetsp:Transcript_25638/g.64159  ORF Transcript_25638/g.64159 Transcript_25638/m.64159 type:complete len:260 (-) Transcript_25638:1527-2306(-)
MPAGVVSEGSAWTRVVAIIWPANTPAAVDPPAAPMPDALCFGGTFGTSMWLVGRSEETFDATFEATLEGTFEAPPWLGGIFEGTFEGTFGASPWLDNTSDAALPPPPPLDAPGALLPCGLPPVPADVAPFPGPVARGPDGVPALPSRASSRASSGCATVSHKSAAFFPSLLRRSTTVPAATSSGTRPGLPSTTAKCSAVFPLRSTALGSAPKPMSERSSVALPASTAAWSELAGGAAAKCPAPTAASWSRRSLGTSAIA